MGDAQIVLNGINGATGDYAMTFDSLEAVVALMRGEAVAREEDERARSHAQALKKRHEESEGEYLGVKYPNNPEDLAQVGWGIVFAENEARTEEIRKALQPLIESPEREAGKVWLYSGEQRYKAGETTTRFLARNGMTITGPVDPGKGPYYLLIIGSPSQIPFRFQYELDAHYAVGRLHFDSVEAYGNYTRSVVAAEAEPPRPARAAFFGAEHPDDPATFRSNKYLVEPLLKKLRAETSSGGQAWHFDESLRGDATWQRLRQLLGQDAPALLLTASHGMELSPDHALQGDYQGALMCSDWPGPKQWREGTLIPPDGEYYFGGAHLDPNASMLGMIAFHFACFGAGTPQSNDFAYYQEVVQLRKVHRSLTSSPFLARLPQALLGHPNGGALAVIGHIDRAWDFLLRLVRGQAALGATWSIREYFPAPDARTAYRQRDGGFQRPATRAFLPF